MPDEDGLKNQLCFGRRCNRTTVSRNIRIRKKKNGDRRSAQGTGSAVPTGQKNPGGQSEQADAPVRLAKVPAGHDWQPRVCGSDPARGRGQRNTTNKAKGNEKQNHQGRVVAIQHAPGDTQRTRQMSDDQKQRDIKTLEGTRHQKKDRQTDEGKGCDSVHHFKLTSLLQRKIAFRAVTRTRTVHVTCAVK
jgi:hypothetical protein